MPGKIKTPPRRRWIWLVAPPSQRAAACRLSIRRRQMGFAKPRCVRAKKRAPIIPRRAIGARRCGRPNQRPTRVGRLDYQRSNLELMMTTGRPTSSGARHVRLEDNPIGFGRRDWHRTDLREGSIANDNGPAAIGCIGVILEVDGKELCIFASLTCARKAATLIVRDGLVFADIIKKTPLHLLPRSDHFALFNNNFSFVGLNICVKYHQIDGPSGLGRFSN
jgi:hypothetical protein